MKVSRLLLREWDEKVAKALEEHGLCDIEKTVGGDRVLIQFSTDAYRRATRTTVDAKEDYYRVLGRFVDQHEFDDDIEKLIMVRAAEGSKIRETVETLIKIGQYRCRGTIRFVIRRYELKWRIRKWTAQQIRLKRLP